MRVHERGSGETRSCGTGACAAAVAAAGGRPGAAGSTYRAGPCGVTLDEAGRVFLSGPAVIVARGETSL